MKVLIVLLLLVMTACTVRMGTFAPRSPDTPTHREATRDTCVDCHDLSSRPDHKATDDCLRCHKLVKGI